MNTFEKWSPVRGSHMSERRPRLSHTLEWMWQDEPTSSIEYFAMNVSERPLRSAISFAPFL